MFKNLRPDKNKATPFIIFSSFLITYLVIRLFVYFFPSIFLDVRGVHIHHFAYGIIIITLVGLYDLIVRTTDSTLHYTAAIFGIGMAFAYDEFGMWLRLQDYDVSRYGYDAVIVISLILLNIIYFGGFWERIGKSVFSNVKSHAKLK